MKRNYSTNFSSFRQNHLQASKNGETSSLMTMLSYKRFCIKIAEHKDFSIVWQAFYVRVFLSNHPTLGLQNRRTVFSNGEGECRVLQI